MGKDHLGSDMRKVKDTAEEPVVIKALDEAEIALLKSYVLFWSYEITFLIKTNNF